jgi:hypothetical protein
LDPQIQFNLRTHLTKQITAVLTIFKTTFRPRTEEYSNKGAVKRKVQVKFTLEQATKAQRGSRDIDILFL